MHRGEYVCVFLHRLLRGLKAQKAGNGPKMITRAQISTEQFLGFHHYRGCTCNLNPV